MTFFYDLNKRLADLAKKQDAKQLAEDAKSSAPKSKLVESIEVAERATGDYSAKKGAAGKDLGKPGKNFAKIAKSSGGGEKGQRIAGAVLAKLRNKNESAGIDPNRNPQTQDYSQDSDVMDYLNDKLKDFDAQQSKTDESALQAYLGKKKYGDTGMKALQKAGREGASKETMAKIRARHDKMDEAEMEEGNEFSGELAQARASGAKEFKVDGKSYPVKEEGGMPMTAKQKSFAKLAPPADKITFADKIAGAKKEVDEMLGDVAAEAIKSAIGRGKQQVADEGNAFTGALAKTPKGGKFKVGNKEFTDNSDIEEGFADMNAWLAQREKEKGTGKFDRKERILPGGMKATTYTRKYDDVEDDSDEPASKDSAPKKRGRPMGKPKGPERVTKGAWKHKTGRVQEEGEEHVCEQCGQPIVEKAKSKAQQKFMGMVHAAQKGEKPASKEVGKVAKSMGKKDAKDFASTKHKGLPNKVKEESTEKEDTKAERAGKKVAKDIEYDEGHKGKDDNRAEKAGKKVTKDIEHDDKKDKKEKKVDETTVAGSVATATSSSKSSSGGMQFGKGVYENFNNSVEKIITESVDIAETISENQGEGKTVIVTASGAEADVLMQLLKAAGLSGQGSSSSCGCGQTPCGCEQVDENSPDWPTNTVTGGENDPNLRTYSGGLNKPKSTGQTTIPVVASQQDRLHTMEESVELERSLFKTWKNYKG
jgi:hypothetical protein